MSVDITFFFHQSLNILKDHKDGINLICNKTNFTPIISFVCVLYVYV